MTVLKLRLLHYSSFLMLDLAISLESDTDGTDIIECNDGTSLRCPSWPRDCESQLVAYGPLGKEAEVVWAGQLAGDIAEALAVLDSTRILKNKKPDWYRRLKLCAADAPPDED